MKKNRMKKRVGIQNDRSTVFRVMKMTFVLLLSCGLNLNATVRAQLTTVTLSMENVKVGEVFQELKKQTQLDFFYSNNEVNVDKRVSIDVKDAPLDQVLREVLGADFTYEWMENLVIIRPVSVIPVPQKKIKVTGVVSDKQGPLPGVTIFVKGTSEGMATDVDGKYSLEVSPDAVLEFSCIGYMPQTVAVKGRTVINVTLAEDVKLLSEVVVVGFGSQKKENLTGAVTTVDVKALEARPVAQVGQALQGVVPGLNFSVNNVGGALGNALSVNIRGGGTIGTGSSGSPLILIDGIEGDMNALNPEDIEKISILKDAAAAAIYGSRAPFGVILITTKSGKSGKTVVSYGSSFRFARPINLPDMLDSYKFALFFNRASQNGGGGVIFDDETIGRILAYQRGEITTTTIPNPDNGMFEFHQKANANENWTKRHFDKTAFTHEHSLNVNGGSEKLSYFMSAAYMNQEGLLKYGDDTFERFNIAGNISAQATDWMHIGLRTRFIREDLDKPLYADDEGLYYHDISRTWPTMPFKDPNGHYMRNSKLEQIQHGGRYFRRRDQIYTQGNVVITPLKNWNITADFGHKMVNSIWRQNLAKVYEWTSDGTPRLMKFNDNSPEGSTWAYYSSQQTNLTTVSTYTDYSWSLAVKHNFKVMLGFNAELFQTEDVSVRRADVITDEVPSINTATGKDVTGGYIGQWSTAGFFGRINYDYDGRYLLEFNGRYDGSSRFMKAERWNFFPSFSVGWNIAREKFWENLTPYVNMLKPRVSWGMLGNQNTYVEGNPTATYYPFYLTQPVGTANGAWLIDGKKPNTARAPYMNSRNMTWEKVKSLNVGLDVGMLNNRLNFSGEWYQRTTEDMVGPPAEVSTIIGISSGNLPKRNNATMVTTGWEFQITWNDRIKNFGYTVSFNISDFKRKVTKYPNESKSLGTYYKGQILGEIWGYETVGIAKSDAEMEAHLKHTNQDRIGTKWAAGDIMYRDLDKNGEISTGDYTADKPGDIRVIGNSTPRYAFGLTLGADWKGIDFRAFFQGVGKRDAVLGGNYFWGAIGSGVWQSMGLKEHYDFFRPEGDPMGENVNGYYPRPLFNSDKNHQTQTRYLQSAAYVRLKNLQVGYSLPSAWVSRIGLSRVRVYFSGDNLFTWTKMSKIFDPEAYNGKYAAGKVYPLSRTLSCGLSVTF